MPPDVPHPGPRPDLFEFPFDEARAAVAAIEAAADELSGLVNRHQAAVEPARVDFQGETRRQFDQAFEGLMDAMTGHQRALDGQADQLEADIATAQARREASLDARAAWARQYDAYQSAQASASTGGLS